MDKLISLDWDDHIQYKNIFFPETDEDRFRATRLIANLNNAGCSDIIIPAAVDKYRELFWEAPWNSLSAKFNIYTSKRTDISLDPESSKHAKPLLSIALDLIKYYKPHISQYCKEFFLTSAGDSPIFLFDSYWFFAAGHINTFSSTVSLLNLCYNKWLGIVLIDKKLVLFPEMLNILKTNTKQLLFIDVTHDTINLSNLRNYFPIDKDSITNIENILLKEHKTFALLQKTFLNPLFLFAEKKSANYLTNPEFDYSNVEPDNNQQFALFNYCYSREESLTMILKALPQKFYFFEKYSQFITYHERNELFRWPSKRDSLSLSKRQRLVSMFNDRNIGIVVVGIVPHEYQILADNVFYLCNLPPQLSSLQLHLYNASCAVIGANSGATDLSFLTDTPTIIFDSPMPFATLPPITSRKYLLLKTIIKDGKIQSPLKYYEIESLEKYFESDSYSPLEDSGYTLTYSSDDAIFNTFTLLEQNMSKSDSIDMHQKSLLENNDKIPHYQLKVLRDKIKLANDYNNSPYAKMLATEFNLSPYNWQ